jgi:hypothetical protein
MHKFTALLTIGSLMLVNPALAREISLHCIGTSSTSEGTGEDSIDIQVRVTTGHIFGFPVYQAPGCLNAPPFPGKIAFKVSSNFFETSCKNEVASSTLQLNRFSGKLSITTFIKKNGEVWTGQYSCTEQTKRF